MNAYLLTHESKKIIADTYIDYNPYVSFIFSHKKIGDINSIFKGVYVEGIYIRTPIILKTINHDFEFKAYSQEFLLIINMIQNELNLVENCPIDELPLIINRIYSDSAKKRLREKLGYVE
jgi:hypothetical protein